MEKNKKQILLTIITLLISTTMFTNKVNGRTIMLLNCEYIEQCKSDSDCESAIDTFIRYTDNKGNTNWNGIYVQVNNEYKTSIFEQYNTYTEIMISKIGNLDMEDDDYCWIDEYSNLSDNCDEKKSIGWDGGKNYYDFFGEGICPSGVRLQKLDDAEIVPAGQDGIVTSNTLYLDNPKYIIYEFEDTEGNLKQIAEGYNSDGKYCVVGIDLTKAFVDEIFYHQKSILINSLNIDRKISFFDVDTNFNNLIISGRGASSARGDKMPECKNRVDCVFNHSFRVILDSNDSQGTIRKAVTDWLSTNNEKFKSLQKITELVNDETFISEVEDLNEKAETGKTYSFKNITSDEMISKLEEAYIGLQEAYINGKPFVDCANNKETSAISSFTSCEIYQNYLGINQISELIKDESKRNSEHMINQNYIVEMIVDQVGKELNNQVAGDGNKINLLDSSRDLKKYTSMFYYALSYMKSNPNAYFLNKEQIDKVNDLVDKFKELVELKGLDIYPITNCEELLGEDLINKINSYLNIVKIAIPIILIAFGIIEFTKAIFAGDEESMKKSQKSFIKRLGISILIFFVPTIVNLLLQLANKVWTTIAPNSCGLLETEEKACYICGSSNSGEYVWRIAEQSSSCTKYSSAKTKKACESMNNK